MPLPIEGGVNHDAPDGQKPIKIGGKANANEPTAVADGDRVDGWFDPQGRLVTAPLFPANLVSATHGPATANPTGTGNTEVVAAPTSGNSIHVTSLVVGNAGSALVRVDIKDGTTTRLAQPLAANGGGFVWYFSPPWKLANAAALNAALSATGDVRVNCQFFVSP